MGNTDIALPTDTVTNTAVQTNGIPAVSTPQESRSVLKRELVINRSPPSCTILTARVKGEMASPLTVLPTCLCTRNNVIGQTSKGVVSKLTLSWAQIASR
jgi:hypothetical protein